MMKNFFGVDTKFLKSEFEYYNNLKANISKEFRDKVLMVYIDLLDTREERDYIQEQRKKNYNNIEISDNLKEVFGKWLLTGGNFFEHKLTAYNFSKILNQKKRAIETINLSVFAYAKFLTIGVYINEIEKFRHKKVSKNKTLETFHMFKKLLGDSEDLINRDHIITSSDFFNHYRKELNPLFLFKTKNKQTINESYLSNKKYPDEVINYTLNLYYEHQKMTWDKASAETIKEFYDFFEINPDIKIDEIDYSLIQRYKRTVTNRINKKNNKKRK